MIESLKCPSCGAPASKFYEKCPFCGTEFIDDEPEFENYNLHSTGTCCY